MLQRRATGNSKNKLNPVSLVQYRSLKADPTRRHCCSHSGHGQRRETGAYSWVVRISGMIRARIAGKIVLIGQALRDDKGPFASFNINAKQDI